MCTTVLVKPSMSGVQELRTKLGFPVCIRLGGLTALAQNAWHSEWPSCEETNKTNRSLKFSTVELRIWSCARPSFPQKNHEKKRSATMWWLPRQPKEQRTPLDQSPSAAIGVTSHGFFGRQSSSTQIKKSSLTSAYCERGWSYSRIEFRHSNMIRTFTVLQNLSDTSSRYISIRISLSLLLSSFS